MLRRWRSLKKIVYAGTILFATIILYATTSEDHSHDVGQEWVLPIVAHQGMLRVDAALHEPLHRLPLGPFEDNPVPVIVETLQLQIPTFNDSKVDDAPVSNAGNADMADQSAVESAAASSAEVQPQGGLFKPAPLAVAPFPASAEAQPQGSLFKPAPLAVAPFPAAPAAHANPLFPPANPPLPAANPPAPAENLSAPAVNPFPPAANPLAPALFPPANLPVAAANPVEPPPSVPATNPPVVAAPAPAAAAAAAEVGPAADVGGESPPAAAAKPQPISPVAPAKPLPDMAKVTEEMQKRLDYTRAQCAKFQIPNQIESEVYLLPAYNLSYCKIPKAGCTYWEQIIAFLNKPNHELAYLGIRSPFQLSKYDIRYTSHFALPVREFKIPEDNAEIMKSTRVLFVRHPLERLWSCYLEKFFLLDFWTTAGIQMKTSGAENKCPKSITFKEFIDFTLPLFNENWAPVTELCNPCVFQPNIIGHVETHRDDTYFTYKQLQHEWIFAEQEKLSREENQMLDVAIYNYQIHSIHWYSFFHRCLTQKELAAKLWEVFKKIGYLSSHAILPDNLSDYNQTTVIRELKSQFRKFPLGPINGRAQQLKMMRRDYESLPKPTMAKILERYALDFQLLGYNTQIPTV